MILKRLQVLGWIFAILIGLVQAQLIRLQFVTRDFWEGEARASRIGGQPMPFQRGSIYDRYGRPLAEGETVNRLSLIYHEFRRESVIGQLIGAGLILCDLPGQPESEAPPAPTVRRVLERPAEWIRFVLETREEALEGLATREADDFKFYVRNLLELEEARFRKLSEAALDEHRPFSTLVEDGPGRVLERLRDQARAIQELAASVDAGHAEFIDLIDRQIEEIRAAVNRSIRRSPSTLSVGQQRAIQKDHESRARVLVRTVTYRSVFLVNLVPERFMGFRVEDVSRRSYPAAARDISPALLGWVGYPTDEMLRQAEDAIQLYGELRSRPPAEIDLDTAEHIEWLRQQIRHHDYRADEEQGRAGLEALLEPVLRGRRGWRIVERDSARQDTRLLEMTQPVNGLDVWLTLDLDLQRASERVLESKQLRGAIVLLDPKDGAIRALASWPNPTRQEIRKEYADLLRDPDHPLHQRAYRPPGNPPPPGSIFKVVAAAAALESGAVDRNTTYECDQFYQVGRTRLKLKCMGRHGSIGLVTALEKSCNIYFYKLARELPLRPVLEMASAFGLGEATGFGDPARLGLPAGAVSLGEMDCPLQPGPGLTFAMRTLIGHAAIDDVTPLQVAGMMAALANGGQRVHPWLIDMIGDQPAPRTAPAPIGLSQETLAVIRTGMIKAAETGTARPRGGVDLRPYKVAAKTGTPEDATGVDHAWIAGYFPHDQPQLAFAIFLEHIGKGGGAAGTPLLGELLGQPEFRR